jgi:hypothetical protein
MILIDDIDTEHIPDCIAPVVERALWYLHASTDVITEPPFVQLLKRNLSSLIDGFNHPNVFGDKALSSIVINHIFMFFLQM